MPFEDEQDEAETGDLVDSERYRIKLRHRHQVTEVDTLRVTGDYVSDPDVLEDFFDSEFRDNVQPENFVTLSRWNQDYVASVTVNHRVNDFYTNINRAPELQFDVPRLQLRDTSFSYTSLNRASLLEQQFAKQLPNRRDFDSGRVDSDNTISYSTKQFGFLNLIPRTRYAGTYYERTIGFETISSVTTSTNDLGEVVESVSERREVVDAGSDFRNVVEFGLEASYKAFKILDELPHGAHDQGRRHVMEPFINYTFIPEPNIEPDQLLQFDFIDQRDAAHDLAFGVRNKLQTKRKGEILDMIDLVVFSNYNIEKVNAEEDDVEFVGWDMDFRWIPRVTIEIDGFYDVPGGQVNTFNTRGWIETANRSKLLVEHRFLNNQRDLLTGQVDLWPMAKWSYTGYARYELERNELEEHSHFLIRRTNCLGLGLGVRQIEDEITFWAQAWLLAFPRATVDLGR
jgi:LPS-assembly protein